MELFKHIQDGDEDAILEYIELEKEYLQEDLPIMASMACLYNQFNILKIIVNLFDRFDIDINMPNQKYLVNTIRNENLDMLKFFIEKGIDIYSPQDTLLYNPLVLASSLGNIDIVKYLVEEKSLSPSSFNSISVKAALNTLGYSQNHTNLVQYLIENGADIDMEKGYAINKAIEQNNKELFDFLLKNNATINFIEKPALTTACEHNNLEFVNLLIQHGATIDLNNSEAMREAVSQGNLEIVKTLIEHGSSINDDILKVAFNSIYNYRNQNTNNHYKKESYNIIGLLVSKGADIHFDKEYCLKIAAERDNLDMVGYLLQKGAMPHFVYDAPSVREHTKDWIKEHYYKYVQLPFMKSLEEKLEKEEPSSHIKKAKI